MPESESSAAREAMEQSRRAVVECEDEIKSIKNALKSLTMGTTSADSTRNTLEVSVHKVNVASSTSATATATDNDGTENNGANEKVVVLPTTFKIHLSSPIEVRTITQLYDPLNPTAEEGLAKFESVEISNALLTVETYVENGDVNNGNGGDGLLKKLGVSASHDLLPLCQDMELWKKGGEKKSSLLEIAIVAEGGIDDVDVAVTMNEKSNESESWEDAVTELVPEVMGEETAEEGEEAYIGEVNENSTDIVEKKEETVVVEEEETKTTTNHIQVPLYTVVIQLEYTPSPEDRRDALYEKLNEVSKRKVAAIESLRKSAGIASRARGSADGLSTTTGGDTGSKSSPAVKSGFLNKTKGGGEKPAVAAVPFWKRWYENTFGPQSMLWVLGPVAKNYIIFVGVSLFIHYRGDLLALPPPV
jgi:hypothetical protein